MHSREVLMIIFCAVVNLSSFWPRFIFLVFSFHSLNVIMIPFSKAYEQWMCEEKWQKNSTCERVLSFANTHRNVCVLSWSRKMCWVKGPRRENNQQQQHLGSTAATMTEKNLETNNNELQQFLMSQFEAHSSHFYFWTKNKIK